MSDERLRDAERRWRASGSDADEAAFLNERVRAGEMSRGRLELIARIGHPAARIACGLEPLPEAPGSPVVRAFEERLAETIAWCATRPVESVPDAFRTEELGRSFKSVLEARRSLLSDGLKRWVDDLARARRRALERDGWPMGVRARTLLGGRLLHFDPDATLSDGGAEVISSGFYDVDNVPAWDTWVALRGEERRPWMPFDHHLVCWIPATQIEHADRGVAVNPEECLRWAPEGFMREDGFRPLP